MCVAYRCAAFFLSDVRLALKSSLSDMKGAALCTKILPAFHLN